MPSNEDNITYTIMSYNHLHDYDLFIDLNGNSYTYGINPIDRKTYSAYDLDALKNLYGSNVMNLENDVYKIDGGNFYVINDDFGYDTLDLSNTKDNFVNLYTSFDTIEAFGYEISDRLLSSVNVKSVEDVINKKLSTLDVTNYEKSQIYDNIYDWLTQNDYTDLIYTGENNLSFTQNTLIEKYIGGSGSDVVIDNLYDNIILTGSGDDEIIILGGDDIIDGGDGYDKLYINAKKEDFIIHDNELLSEKEIIKFKNIEEINFLDDTLYLV
jgi:Ca2+-binding RTX toxin-like protein